MLDKNIPQEFKEFQPGHLIEFREYYNADYLNGTLGLLIKRVGYGWCIWSFKADMILEPIEPYRIMPISYQVFSDHDKP